MAFKTRNQRAPRWRFVRDLIATAATLTIFQLLGADGLMAQVKAPNKNHLKASSKQTQPAEDVQPFAIGADGSVSQQLLDLKIDPSDAQAAAETVAKALGQVDSKAASSGRAVLQSQGPGQPRRLVSLQLYSAKSLAVELHRTADGSYGYKLAPGATGGEDERISSLPSTTTAASPSLRSVVSESVGIVKASSSTLHANLAQIGASPATLKELTHALAGFQLAAAKIDVLKGKTADGTPRLLAASIGDDRSRQSFWWFAPPNQPDGWFDEDGRRLGGTMLAEPKPDSRISSPFGTRRYYGRKRGGGFHNGIDYEGKTGEPIYAAADGVINHQGWYFNYGRTVKISHADSFETLYAHMSRFADGLGPGSPVRKGDIVGYVGSSGRSTGAHLHFSVIVNGQFVDPAPYVTEKGGMQRLTGETLVAFRQWQQELRKAAAASSEKGKSRFFRFLQGPPDSWTNNPFAQPSVDRR